jgi:hypothetical protein
MQKKSWMFTITVVSLLSVSLFFIPSTATPFKKAGKSTCCNKSSKICEPEKKEELPARPNMEHLSRQFISVMSVN